MINPDKLGVGDFVEVIEAFKDYVKVGQVYRLLDSRVPKEPTSAIGWLCNIDLGTVDVSQAFRLPHDKITALPRSKVAKLIEPILKEATKRKRDADREYNLVKSRLEGLMSHESKYDEANSLLNKTFYWV